jgi:biopolymer transport protein ExbD
VAAGALIAAASGGGASREATDVLWREKPLPVDLPLASNARTFTQPPGLALSILADGDRYAFDGLAHVAQAPLGRGELRAVLKGAAERDPAMNVRLDIDRRVPYGRIMEVMDTLELYGLRHIHFRCAAAATGEGE